jgi:hypothetical protein
MGIQSAADRTPTSSLTLLFPFWWNKNEEMQFQNKVNRMQPQSGGTYALGVL